MPRGTSSSSSDPGGETPPAPIEEDLLVLYLNGEIDAGVIGRLADAGGTQVAARNPTGIRGVSRSWTRMGTGWS
jgi:hypothetical protein